MKKTKKLCNQMKSSYVLFGYEKDNINNCKYLQINNGYKFVDDVEDAT